MESAKARGCPLRPEEPWEREVYKRGEADRRLILRQMVRRCGPPERWTWRPQSLECESISLTVGPRPVRRRQRVRRATLGRAEVGRALPSRSCDTNARPATRAGGARGEEGEKREAGGEQYET